MTTQTFAARLTAALQRESADTLDGTLMLELFARLQEARRIAAARGGQ